MCPYDDEDLDFPEIGVRCMFYDSRCSTAVSSASKVSGVVQGVAIGFSVIYGILNEKLPNARYGFMLAAFIGALSYGTVGVIEDPRDKGLYVSAAFMGMSQISMVMASQIFLVRQLPKEHLGSLSGIFSVFGGLGVIMIGVGGGELFEQ